MMEKQVFKIIKNYFKLFSFTILGPAQLFLTGPGISFLLLLPNVSAQQAPIPGQLLFS